MSWKLGPRIFIFTCKLPGRPFVHPRKSSRPLGAIGVDLVFPSFFHFFLFCFMYLCVSVALLPHGDDEIVKPKTVPPVEIRAQATHLHTAQGVCECACVRLLYSVRSVESLLRPNRHTQTLKDTAGYEMFDSNRRHRTNTDTHTHIHS